MAKKTHDTETNAPPIESRSSPALSLDPDYSQPTVSPETPVISSAQNAALDKANAAQVPPARQGDDSRPFCGKHNCLMKSVGSSPTETRYSCPVALCDQKEKRARGAVQIPREPQACPDIRCRGKQSFMEVDVRRSSTAHLSMVCPNCAYEIKVPRPTFNSGRRTYEREEGDLAAR